MKKETITKFRMTHKMNQADLADLLNVRKVTLSAYETGHLEITKILSEKMERLIDEFGIDWNLVPPPHKYIAPYQHRTGQKRAKRKPVEEDEQKEIKEATMDLKELLKVVGDKKNPHLPPASNHYNGGSVDHIDVIKFSQVNFSEDENIGFYRINAIKYLARYGKKNGYDTKDLEKALYYIEKLKEATQ